MPLFGRDSDPEDEDEELRENMDKIREMVTGGRSSQSGDTGSGTAASTRQEDRIRTTDSIERDEPSPGPASRTERSTTSDEDQDDLFVSVDEEIHPVDEESDTSGSDDTIARPGTLATDTSDSPDITSEADNDTAATSSEPVTDQTADPDPVSTSTGNGPLFIRVEKFRQARRTVHGLHDLTEDIRTKVAGLKTTLKEDREIEETLDKAVSRLNDSVTDMKDILSP